MVFISIVVPVRTAIGFWSQALIHFSRPNRFIQTVERFVDCFRKVGWESRDWSVVQRAHTVPPIATTALVGGVVAARFAARRIDAADALIGRLRNRNGPTVIEQQRQQRPTTHAGKCPKHDRHGNVTHHFPNDLRHFLPREDRFRQGSTISFHRVIEPSLGVLKVQQFFLVIGGCHDSPGRGRRDSCKPRYGH